MKQRELLETLTKMFEQGGVYVQNADADAGTFEIEMPDESRYRITIDSLNGMEKQ